MDYEAAEEAELLFFNNRNIDREKYVTDPIYNRTIKAFMIEFITGFQGGLKYQQQTIESMKCCGNCASEGLGHLSKCSNCIKSNYGIKDISKRKYNWQPKEKR